MKLASRANRRPWTRLAPAAFLGVLGALFCAACEALPEPPGLHVEQLYTGRLEQVQPMEVVVAPILDESGHKLVPDRDLREAFQVALLKRRYSPLALEYVDRRVVEAAYRPGSLQEDAVLEITVRSWNLDRWESANEVTVEVEAWMLLSEDASQLWGGRLSRTIDLTVERERHETDVQALRKGCEVIAQELMEVMPARSPRP